MFSKHAPGSATSSRDQSPAAPAPGGQQIDPYRVLSTHVKKPLAPLLPGSEPLLPTLLSLDSTTYSSRLSGKTLQTTPDQPSTVSSPLVTGRKRNRGNALEKSKARAECQAARKERESLGHEGLRKVKRRLGSVIGKGQCISYTALVPLYHLHTIYICQLLALPPLPALIPPFLPPSNPEPLQTKISKADFTGIFLSVIAARCESLIGIKGIVIEETAETFRIVVEDDKVRVVPKQGSLFRLSFPAFSPPPQKPLAAGIVPSPYPQDLTHHLATCPRIEMDLLGSAFAYRSIDRAGRKFRPAQGGGGGSGWADGWVAKAGEMGQMLDGVDGCQRLNKSEKSEAKQGPSKRKRNKSRRKDLPAWGNL
ncbi:hypothetical protein B9479_002243 [Cryptococcus floricola]|uniref:Uncharacterized protein n=1 Tax=Cryptococcus floricola TaxID=2591691 RepID=A0A5D3B2I4_9TREE|nr:hypothetical protein B9479_002243 [Cryptococcus floricola]